MFLSFPKSPFTKSGKSNRKKKNHNDHNSENADTIKKKIQLLLNFLINKTTPTKRTQKKQREYRKNHRPPEFLDGREGVDRANRAAPILLL